MFQGRKQEGPELALSTVDSSKGIVPKQASKEFLGQILRLFRSPSLAPNEGVKGIPIGAAKLLQRNIRAWSSDLFGSQHPGPLRGGKGDVLAHACKHLSRMIGSEAKSK